MERTMIALFVLLPLTVAAGEPIAVTEQCPASSPARFQLVGFTAATLAGGNGLLGFTQACQAEFPGSRFCTLPDIFNTTTIPDLGVGDDSAWVEPGGIEVIGSLNGNCVGWGSANSFRFGMRINKSGKFSGRACSIPNSVSCCAPVE